ncbi:hypothetical protein CWN94_21355 [Vibrio splendidus]|nr:hypothetical protein CWN94_21355 [Vibrio splendidus]
MSIGAKWIHFLIVYQINKTLHIYFVSAKFSKLERSFRFDLMKINTINTWSVFLFKLFYFSNGS